VTKSILPDFCWQKLFFCQPGFSMENTFFLPVGKNLPTLHETPKSETGFG